MTSEASIPLSSVVRCGSTRLCARQMSGAQCMETRAPLGYESRRVLPDLRRWERRVQEERDDRVVRYAELPQRRRDEKQR